MITNLVEQALRDKPETRSNDRELILEVWARQDPEYYKRFKLFFLSEAIMPESITRARRKIQEGGKYPPTKQAEKIRTQKFKAMRETVGDVIDYIF